MLRECITKLDNTAMVLHVFLAAFVSAVLTHFVALVDSLHENSRRPDLSQMGDSSLFVLAVVLSPVVETLIFQLLPVFLLSRWHRSGTEKYLASSIPFALLHSSHGFGIFIGVGVVCGAIFAFSAVWWVRRSFAASFWVVCSVHAIHNFYFYAGDRLIP
jgi:hypothetical protein